MKWNEFTVNKISFGQGKYSKNLAKITKPPKEIFYRGDINCGVLDRTIAIIGTRKMTNYGKQVVDEFVSHLVAKGITTISGFMYGIDTEVHKKTLEYGGKTVAVFGNGLDYIYPPENEKLYSEILEKGGLVMSEYESDFKPQLWTYPARNRIVAALATIGVLVVEADLESGSMITAKIAKQQKKKLWAIPGPITTKTSRGTNFLIQNCDAKMAITPNDITGKSMELPEKKGLEMNKFETEIYATLENENLSSDEIAVKISGDIVSVTQTLTMMGLKGIVGEMGGKFFLTKK